MFASSTRLVGSLAPRGLLRVKGAKTLGKKRVSWDCAFSLQYPTHVGGEGQGGQAQQGPFGWELRRIHLPRTPVNKPSREPRALARGTILDGGSAKDTRSRSPSGAGRGWCS